MHELLSTLAPGSLMLDLGCAAGSFPESCTLATVIRADREGTPGHPTRFAQADAAQLPFPDALFAAVISNHSLEHFHNLPGCLREIGRVLGRDGALFVAVPDASTVSDRIYRAMGPHHGHVNPFTSCADLAQQITAATGLAHVATRTLNASLSFLNRRTSPRPAPRRRVLFGGGYEWTLFAYILASRWLDRRLSTRFSVYGWALYFGRIEAPLETTVLSNVCIACGSGHPAGNLIAREGLLRTYICPDCGTRNPLLPE